MIRSKSAQIAAVTLLGLSATTLGPRAEAQQPSTTAGAGARPRSTDERVTTEAATPPPVNSDYRRAAEGTLPLVPGVPAQAQAPGVAIDPAARPLVGGPAGVGTVTTSVVAANPLPPGLDAALTVEHAVEMAIEGTTLMTLAQVNKPDETGNDSVKSLLNHANDELRMSKDLMSKAAAIGGQVEANSPVRGFYAAANNYLKALEYCNTPGTLDSPNNRAEIAAINHAIKAVMDGNHLAAMSNGLAPTPALDPLLAHGRMMRDEGVKALEKMAGTTPVDPASPPTTQVLAQRGRELINAANQLAPLHAAALSYGGLNGVNGGLPNGPVPGRLQDTRPEIIGGTFGTGSPSVGTANGAEAARNVRPGVTEGPGGVLREPTANGAPGSGVSSYGVGNNNTPPTNSSAGARPR